VDEARGFKKLLAWQRADELASVAFRISREISRTDRWLASQLSRAAISVPANIAEGYGRGSLGDYMRLLDIARGSLAEVEYYFHFLTREGVIAQRDSLQADSLLNETGRLLTGLWQSLKAKNASTWDHSGGMRQVREEFAIYEVGE
jgi:four helix bundle protein